MTETFNAFVKRMSAETARLKGVAPATLKGLNQDRHPDQAHWEATGPARYARACALRAAFKSQDWASTWNEKARAALKAEDRKALEELMADRAARPADLTSLGATDAVARHVAAALCNPLFGSPRSWAEEWNEKAEAALKAKDRKVLDQLWVERVKHSEDTNDKLMQTGPVALRVQDALRATQDAEGPVIREVRSWAEEWNEKAETALHAKNRVVLDQLWVDRVRHARDDDAMAETHNLAVRVREAMRDTQDAATCWIQSVQKAMSVGDADTVQSLLYARAERGDPALVEATHQQYLIACGYVMHANVEKAMSGRQVPRASDSQTWIDSARREREAGNLEALKNLVDLRGKSTSKDFLEATLEEACNVSLALAPYAECEVWNSTASQALEDEDLHTLRDLHRARCGCTLEGPARAVFLSQTKELAVRVADALAFTGDPSKWAPAAEKAFKKNDLPAMRDLLTRRVAINLGVDEYASFLQKTQDLATRMSQRVGELELQAQIASEKARANKAARGYVTREEAMHPYNIADHLVALARSRAADWNEQARLACNRDDKEAMRSLLVDRVSQELAGDDSRVFHDETKEIANILFVALL